MTATASSRLLVILDKASRSSVASVADLPLRSAQGVYVPLSQVADVYREFRPLPCPASRRAAAADGDGQCRGARHRLLRRKREGRGRRKHVAFPSGTYVGVSRHGGRAIDARSARSLLNSLIAGVGIVLLLAVITQNGAQSAARSRAICLSPSSAASPRSISPAGVFRSAPWSASSRSSASLCAIRS